MRARRKRGGPRLVRSRLSRKFARNSTVSRRSEVDAIGRASADRTIAGHKLLALEKGYDWAGSKWERETKIETRLGDETITLRLARIDGGRVVPWISADKGDGRRAWALSEVSLRRSRCSGVSNPPDVQKLVEAAQHGWTL